MGSFACRLAKITMSHMLNVNQGEISFIENENTGVFRVSSITGIYGQNGSGKTACIHALRILWHCLRGLPLPREIINYIQYGQNSASFSFEIIMTGDHKKYQIFYDFSVLRRTNTTEQEDYPLFYVGEEKISYRLNEDSKRTLLYTVQDEETIGLRPKKLMKELSDFKKDFLLNLGATAGIADVQGKSFLFSSQFLSLLRSLYPMMGKGSIFEDVFEGLSLYAKQNFHVFGNQENGLINLSIGMPMAVRMQDGKKKAFGDILVPALPSANKTSIAIPADMFHIVQSELNEISPVISAIIPGLKVYLRNLGKELDPEGQEMIRMELVSRRNNVEIPIRYESEGIKKLICLLPNLIGAFSNPSMTIAVDELDAGIFEYLLGEILSLFKEQGKGQIIFTSHNLRPLEVLDKSSIVFTTTNPWNRYIRLTGIKPNNNLRDVYYRDIQLGGALEELYDPTDRYELAYALREAGKNE